jgi:hypothetical protein
MYLGQRYSLIYAALRQPPYRIMNTCHNQFRHSGQSSLGYLFGLLRAKEGVIFIVSFAPNSQTQAKCEGSSLVQR